MHSSISSNKKTSRIAIGGIIFIAIHGLVFAQFLMLRTSFNVDPEIIFQFFVIFGLDFASSILMLLFYKFKIKLVLLTLIVILSSVLSVLFAGELGIRFSFLLLVMFAGFLCDSVFSIIVPTVVYLFSVILFGNVVTPWDVDFRPITREEILSMMVVGAVLALLLTSRLAVLKQNQSCEQERRKLQNAVKELSDANLGYSTFAQFVQHQASADERNRIARDIHDGVGYTLTNIMMLSEAALSYASVDKAVRERLDAIRVQARTGLADTRRSLRLLKSAESKLPTGLAAIQQMLDIFQKATGVEVSLQRLAKYNVIEHSSVFITIYRFIQECLTNAFHHGHATKVIVRMQTDGEWLFVSVLDNGKGSLNVEEGIGLEGMRERIESLGGELNYYSKSGFTVVARLPVYEGADAD